VPLFVQNKIYGCFYVKDKNDETGFTADDLAILAAFSSSAAVSLENAILNTNLIEQQKLKKEMEIASKIQEAILPKDFNNQFFDIYGMMIPAEEVGGDYYDFIIDRKGQSWFCIGDVSSHGVTPGLIMMMAQSIINTMIQTGDYTPKQIIDRLNIILYDNISRRMQRSEYMTISIFCHKGDGNFIASGLHESFLIYRSEEKLVEKKETKGMWAGIVADISHATEDTDFKLENDDVLFLYTDGVIEAKNKDNTQYDMVNLQKHLAQYAGGSSKHLVEEIKKQLDDFIFQQNDDITMLAIRKI
jgi:serine phosphatase RsbU (regulator of sigma subunit)